MKDMRMKMVMKMTIMRSNAMVACVENCWKNREKMEMKRTGKSSIWAGFLVAIVMGIGLVGFGVTARADGFLSAFEEIPLQQGFEEEEAMTFDTEELRIVEQYITSTSVTRAEFLRFYKETLKSLGWEYKGEKWDVYTFVREDETLTLTVESDDPLVVLFTLKPLGK